MSDILCLYYSRSGNTRQTMAEIAEALEAELVEFTDGVDRQGRKGYFRSGLDAMRRSTHPLEKFETAKPLEEYRLVILGSPVWAMCSGGINSFRTCSAIWRSRRKEAPWKIG